MRFLEFGDLIDGLLRRRAGTPVQRSGQPHLMQLTSTIGLMACFPSQYELWRWTQSTLVNR